MFTFFILLFIICGNFNWIRACTTQTTVTCSTRDITTRVINVWGNIPLGNCSLVQIGSDKFIFDPVMINAVWITLINTDTACITNIGTKAQNLLLAMNYSTIWEVVILSLTAQYYRIILVTRGCTANCSVYPFSADMEARLRSANQQLYPIFTNLNDFGSICLNGGTIDTSYTGAGYKCICTGAPTFVGPMCEYMDVELKTPITYFNVFRNGTRINILFSIFSNGITGNFSLLTIKNGAYQKVVEVLISESRLLLKTEDKIFTTINQAIDTQFWYDINLVVTPQNATLWINNQSNVSLLASQTNADFRAFYLIIYEIPSNHKICLKNFIVNRKLLNLNTPNYLSCCTSRCPCTANEECNCRPFVSDNGNNCFCKFGYVLNAGVCIQSTASYSQITDSVTANVPIISPFITRLDFGFRTLSNNGTLLTLALSTPPVSLAIQILNSNLILNVTNQAARSVTYNVSNGKIHIVTLNVMPYLLQLTLDSNLNYSRSFVNWSLLPTAVPTITVLSIGPMVKPFISTINNLTTCFSAIRMTQNGTVKYMNPSTNVLPTPCTSGPNCSSIALNCSDNQVCNDTQWQNTQCVCITNFTSVNFKCIFNQCLTNPCQNGGECAYNSATGNYSCTCAAGFLGTDCSMVTATASLWWIAVLVVLLLLLIILIVLLVYCFFYRRRNPANNNPSIVKINENIVTYNDQAGECDYNGPPINFVLMKTALNNNGPIANYTNKQIPDLMNKKEEFDKNNNDLILDHPLEYGYEGYDSENGSISSIGSKSADSQYDSKDDHNINNLGDLFNKDKS